jgi:hypothetical protein
MSAATLTWRVILLAAMAIMGGLAPIAQAGLLTTPLALNDGFGPDAGQWRGSAHVVAGPIGGGANELDAVVEWAAFAPGKFQLYLNGAGPGAVDPGAPGEVVYAYEVVSVAKAKPGIDLVTVGVDAADARGSVSPTTVGLTGGPAATDDADQTTSMLWEYLGPSLAAGGKSPIMVFSSPFAPQLDALNVSSGVATTLVSPLVASIGDRIFQNDVPEPATISLLGLAAVAFVPRRRR